MENADRPLKLEIVIRHLQLLGIPNTLPGVFASVPLGGLLGTVEAIHPCYPREVERVWRAPHFELDTWYSEMLGMRCACCRSVFGVASVDTAVGWDRRRPTSRSA